MDEWKSRADTLIGQFKDEPDKYAKIAKILFDEGLAKDYQKAREMVRSHFRRTPVVSKPREGFEYKSDGVIVSTKFITARDGQEMTPEFLLSAHGLDIDKWVVVSYINNMWNTQVKGGDTQISYQSKLTAKPKTVELDLKEIDRHFAELDRINFTPPAPKPIQGDIMVEVNIADLHLSKLCWHGNTPENFDIKIARDTFFQVLVDIVEQIKNLRVSYITFVWANDFFNSDTIENTTTAGTRQEVDVRWQKLFNVGVEMLVRGIEILSDIAPVRTFYTPSNHDEVNGYHALKFIEAWFRKDPNVKVDISAQPRKYQLFGNTLIGYCHGHKEDTKHSYEKASRLASAMPVEASALWSKSKYREFHAAHLHSEQMIEEINGVIVRRISAPTATDTWHNENGFIGAVRKAQAFIYDRDWGLIHTINAPVRVESKKSTTEILYGA